MGISFRAAQNYIETYYLQLKATQVSLIHTKHPPASLQPTQPGTLLRIWLEARHHPFLCVKHINSISVATKGEDAHATLHKLKRERVRVRQRKIQYRKKKKKGQGTEGIVEGEGWEKRDSPEK